MKIGSSQNWKMRQTFKYVDFSTIMELFEASKLWQKFEASYGHHRNLAVEKVAWYV